MAASLYLSCAIQLWTKTNKYLFSIGYKMNWLYSGKEKFKSLELNISSKTFLFSVLEKYCAFSLPKKAKWLLL